MIDVPVLWSTNCIYHQWYLTELLPKLRIRLSCVTEPSHFTTPSSPTHNNQKVNQGKRKGDIAEEHLRGVDAKRYVGLIITTKVFTPSSCSSVVYEVQSRLTAVPPQSTEWERSELRRSRRALSVSYISDEKGCSSVETESVMVFLERRFQEG